LSTSENNQEVNPKKSNRIGKILLFGIAIACFYYIYYRLNGAALREGLSLVEYMLIVFAAVNWIPWLLMMTGYCLFYFSIDTLIITRALGWFIKDTRYTDILPIRASAYIISMFNEQIGKGAMAYYLNRRDQVSGWEVSSLMLFIMFCEIFYLLVWATIGFSVGGQDLPEVFGLIKYIAIGGAIFFTLWVFFFRGPLFQNNRIRNLEIFSPMVALQTILNNFEKAFIIPVDMPKVSFGSSTNSELITFSKPVTRATPSPTDITSPTSLTSTVPSNFAICSFNNAVMFSVFISIIFLNENDYWSKSLLRLSILALIEASR